MIYKELDKKHIYYIWRNIHLRCEKPKTNKKYISYVNCAVCDEWSVFDNFYNWYIKNFYQIPNQKMCVDKDVLCKNNKLYSPQTCCILPNDINVLLTNRKSERGDYPLGVYKKDKKYIAKCKYENKTIWIGSYDNVNDAFNAYKYKKEELIKKKANEYKLLLPQRIYEALLNYSIEITD